jgi:hypothetical protein
MDKSLWESEAELIASKTNVSLEEARTFVILRWMYLKGDLRPLADAIIQGREIDQAVLNCLAAMIFDDKTLPDGVKDISPYRLEAKRRYGKKGRPREPGKNVRDFTMAEKYRALFRPGKSDETFDTVAAEFGVSNYVVRLARTNYNK